MSKACDRVEWSFIKGMLNRISFPNKWVSLIMRCICFVSDSILINGNPYKHIVPSGHLHQGDLLSPYLFLIRAESLSTLLRKAIKSGDIYGGENL